MPTIVEVLGDYAADLRTAEVSAHVRHHAKRVIVDWFACLLPGSLLPPATSLMAALEDEIGRGGAIIYGPLSAAPMRTAALINGTASHIIEFDDIFRDAVYHPGCPAISAALAVCQARGLGGDALIRAVIAGYEVSTRIGVAVQPSHYDFWHTTGTIGTFAAAASASVALGLDAGRTAHALANAATMAAALQQAFRSDAHSKPLHAGHAAEAGVLAALGAERGMTGALDVLEGEAGFGAAMSRAADWAKAVADLGTRFNIAAMTVKNHGCCGHTFAAIDAALALQAEHDFRAEDVARVIVGGYRATLEVTGRKSVSTPFEGRFSTPFTVATALVHGSVRLAAFEPERLRDPVVQDLMKRIDVVLDAQCVADFPGRRSARLEITLRDGRVLSRYQATRKGDPDDPLTDDELAAKFRELAAPAVGADAAEELLGRLLRLEELADVRFAPVSLARAAE